MSPSCFKLIRAFARGLRSEFMEAATQLLDGPFALCRLQAKVDRWHDAIAPFMAADAAAGLYPARDSEAGTLGSTLGTTVAALSRERWESVVREFRDTVLPYHFDRFRESVSCEREYPSEYRTREPRSQRGDRVAEGWTLEAPDLAIAMVNEMMTSKQPAAVAANRGR